MIKLKLLMFTMILCICFMMPASAILNAKTIEQEITAFDESPGDEFGISVAISDRFAVIGSYEDDYLPEEPSDYTQVLEDAGSVHIYQFNGNTWEFQQKIIPETPKPFMKFGNSVAIENDYIAVGAYIENGDELSSSDAVKYTQCGVVYIFKYNGIRWVQEARLVPDDVGEMYKFGFSISLSGNYVIVGCNTKKPLGAAYIFKNNQGSWTQQQMLTSGNEIWVRFGYSVSISGNYACVGADQDYYNDVKTGAVYIYKRENETWIYQKRLVDKDGNRSDGFGKSVSISGDYILVGAPGHDGCGMTSGMAYYAIRNETGWSDPLKLSGDVGHVAGIKFGQSVSMSENGAIVGALLGNGNETQSGAVFTYGIKDENLIKLNILYANDGHLLDGFGKNVALHRKHIVVGAPNRKSDTGAAYIFTDVVNGDINNNNVIDIMDAVLLLKKIVIQ